MICPRCGVINPDDAERCTRCRGSLAPAPVQACRAADHGRLGAADRRRPPRRRPPRHRRLYTPARRRPAPAAAASGAGAGVGSVGGAVAVAPLRRPAGRGPSRRRGTATRPTRVVAGRRRSAPGRRRVRRRGLRRPGRRRPRRSGYRRGRPMARTRRRRRAGRPSPRLRDRLSRRRRPVPGRRRRRTRRRRRLGAAAERRGLDRVDDRAWKPQGTLPTYLPWAVLCTILLFPIGGIVAIVYGVLVNRRAAAGDWEGASRASRLARHVVPDLGRRRAGGPAPAGHRRRQEPVLAATDP